MKSSFSEEYSRFPPICSAEISEKLTSSYIQMDPFLLFCHIPLVFKDTTNMATNAAKDMENCFYRGTLSKGEGSRPFHRFGGCFLGNQTCSYIQMEPLFLFCHISIIQGTQSFGKSTSLLKALNEYNEKENSINNSSTTHYESDRSP